MKLNDGKISISIEDVLSEVKKNSLRELFEEGVVEGYFNDLIDDLLEGEIFGDSYRTRYEVKYGGLETDTLNELRKKIVKSIKGLEEASFEYEHNLYVKSQAKLEQAQLDNYEKEKELKLLKRKEKHIADQVKELSPETYHMIWNNG